MSFFKRLDTRQRREELPDFSLLETSPRAFFMTDALGVVLARNEAARALSVSLGQSPGVGQKMRTMFGNNAEADAAVYRAMRSAASEGAAVEVFALFGNARPGPARVEISRHPDGRHFLWSVELVVAEPQEKPRSDEGTLEEAPVAFFSADRGGQIVAMNAALRDWIGAPVDGAEPISLTDLFGEAAEKLSPALARDEETVEERLRLNCTDGTSAPVHVFQRFRNGGDGEGRTQSFVVRAARERVEKIGRDVQRLVRFLDDAPVAVAVTTLDGIVVEANDRLAVMSGGVARVGAEIALAFRLEDREDVEERIRMVASGGAPGRPLDIKLTGEAGTEHEAQFYVHRIDTESGELLLTYVIDVSERKMIEQQLAQVQKMQAVGKLAGGIAHDVNNVLTAIRGHCDLLMLRHHEGDPDFDHLHQIRSQTIRAADVISKLLAFSRRQTMKREVTQLSDMLDDIRYMLNPLVTERVKFTQQHARDLGLVRIDRSEFQRVIINLAVNACDAMGNGGDLAIRTRNVAASEAQGFGYPEVAANDYVLIEMSDTGTGMAPEVKEKVFEPFFTTKGAGKGTGLGLSTAYGIIKQMDGYIYCESAPGEGTTFRIFLPHYRGTQASEKPGAKPVRQQPRDLSGSGKILLVEDEDSVRSFAVRALELRGYTVLSASGGEEALEIIDADRGEIDLIVSDVVMPDLNGPEMMREVRKVRPEIRFIFVSGYAEDAFREELMDDESFYFLAKPFSLKDLAVTVKQALEA